MMARAARQGRLSGRSIDLDKLRMTGRRGDSAAVRLAADVRPLRVSSFRGLLRIGTYPNA